MLFFTCVFIFSLHNVNEPLTKSGEEKFSHRRDSNPRPCNHESGALTTELSYPRSLLAGFLGWSQKRNPTARNCDCIFHDHLRKASFCLFSFLPCTYDATPQLSRKSQASEKLPRLQNPNNPVRKPLST